MDDSKRIVKFGRYKGMSMEQVSKISNCKGYCDICKKFDLLFKVYSIGVISLCRKCKDNCLKK